MKTCTTLATISVVFLFLVLFTSCQKDNISDLATTKTEGELVSPEKLNLDEYVNDMAVFSKDVVVPNSSTKKLGVESLQLTLKSGNQDILDLVDSKWLSFKYNSILDDAEATLEESESEKQEEDQDQDQTKNELTKFEADDNILVVQIEGWNVGEGFDTEARHPISLKFDPALEKIVTEHELRFIISINYDNVNNNKKAFRWLTSLDKVWVKGQDYSRGWYYYTNWGNTSPTYYHSYKYFYDNNYYLPYHTDVVAACCYNRTVPWKTMKYITTNGYIYGISFDRDYCLFSGYGKYECFKG